MQLTAVLQTLLHGNQLKRTARTGWVQRGIPQPESVAAHSFGVTYTALILAQQLAESIDGGKLLAMAAIHDLPEGLTTDIPTPAWRFLPSGIKTEVERGAMAEMLSDSPFSAALMPLWEEYQAGETLEAKLVHDADKLDMVLQAYLYEQQFGNTLLADFWRKPAIFYFPQSQAIYEELRSLRENGKSPTLP